MISYNDILSFENDYYKELYYDGAKQRDRINSKFTPTITLLTAETSGIIWIIFNLVKKMKSFNFISVTATIILCFIILFGLVALVNFLFCFLKYGFLYPKPADVKNFIKENKTYIGEYTEKEIVDNIVEQISSEYITMAIKNNKEINNRSKYLNKCYIGIVYTLLFMIIEFLILLFM